MNQDDIESEKRRVLNKYETQLSLYKHSLEESLGKTVKETYLYMIEYGLLIHC